MKIKTFVTILGLFLLSLATQQSATAQSASGQYQFSFEDDYTKYVEFDAVGRGDGSATGSMFYSDAATLVYYDLDGAGDPEVKYPGFSIKVSFDAMEVNKNQAVMSGTITDSDVREMIGQRVLLTVEDNGDNTKEPDRLTWGIYKPVVRDWKPSDAERNPDPGVGLRWHATDAERRDDVGYDMPRDESITAKSFPISSYNFADIVRGAGDIKVVP